MSRQGGVRDVGSRVRVASGPSIGRRCGCRPGDVTDLLLAAGLLVSFVVCAGYLSLCARITEDGESNP